MGIIHLITRKDQEPKRISRRPEEDSELARTPWKPPTDLYRSTISSLDPQVM
jgi:hypothetical protein